MQEVFFIQRKSLSTLHKVALSIIASIFIIIILIIIFNRQPQPLVEIEDPIPIVEPVLQEEQNIEPLIVEIKGAVNKPGIYELPVGSRLYELVNLAGGLLPESDGKEVNQAALLLDGQSIYIPLVGEEVAVGEADTGSTLININTADAIALQELPGIGPSKAEAIIRYREQTPFTSIEQLNEVDGIGEKTMEQLTPLISIK